MLNLLYPVLAQILWTFVVLGVMGRARYVATKSGEVDRSKVALSQEAWPPAARAASNNFSNQFESPVLFYALCGVATYVAATNWLMTLFAWIFVATRVVHTLIHTGANKIEMRAPVFALGFAMLVCMWAGVVLKLL